MAGDSHGGEPEVDAVGTPASRESRGLGGWRYVPWIAWGEASGRLLVLAAQLLAARWLGPREFGVAATTQMLAGTIWLGSNWGGDLYGIRELARGNASPSNAKALLSARAFAAFIACLGAGVATLVTFPGRPGVVLGAVMYVIGLASYPDWVFRGSQAFRHLAAMSAALGTVMLLLILLVVRKHPDAVLLLLTVSLTYPLVALPFARTAFRFTGLRGAFYPSPRHWLRMVAGSGRMGASQAMASSIQTLPLWITSVIAGERAAGILAAAGRFIQVIGTASFMLGMAFVPDFALLRPGELIAKARSLVLSWGLVGLLVAGAGWFVGPSLIHAVYGSTFASAIPVFHVLVLAVFLIFVRNPLRLALMASGNERTENRAMIMGLATAALGAWLFLPRYGLMAAAVAIVAAELVLTSVMVTSLGLFGRRDG